MFNCADVKVEREHCSNIGSVLIIEDSSLLRDNIKKSINDRLEINCDTANTEQETMELLQKNRYDLIIADLHLSEGTGNLIGHLVREKNRIIVITDSDNEENREKLISLQIVDYLYKTDEESIINYLISSIIRLQANADATVIICDDSRTSRLLIKQEIVSQNLAYIELEDGQQAYECIINKGLKIDLLITDIVMPNMDGINLIRHIRHRYNASELPILAVSGSNKHSLVAQLLKTGANDYVDKPIKNEEFLTRMNILLDHSRLFKQNKELIKELRTAATTDFLTKLYNRNYFYSTIKVIQAQAKRHNQPYGIVMGDIDFFKKVNDSYGHEVGDIALKSVATIIKESARESDIACRWGGEEFLILVPNTNIEELVNFSQRIRKIIERTPVIVGDSDLVFNVTVSFGVTLSNKENCEDVEEIIDEADKKLYKAKKSGRNCVVFD
ncbi:MAG: diguanylate cyclase [Sulfurimonas sp.]